MTTPRQREIVIEFERIHLIRKRATTRSFFCDACGTVSDVISHGEAAGLFETTTADILEFIQENDCHYQVSSQNRIYLCVASLLEKMNRKNRMGLLRA